jgi:hypothetical protein
MVNYQEGKIYKIICNQIDKVYIGSTCAKYLSYRMTHHRASYKKWSNDNNSIRYITSFKLLEDPDAKIILIEQFPCNSKDELRAREQYWIEKYGNKCVNKQAAYTGKTQQEYKHDWGKIYREKNKEKIKKQDREYRELNKERLKMKFTCDVCGATCRVKDKLRHNRTQKHLSCLDNEQNREYLKLKRENPEEWSKRKFTCDVCGVTCRVREKARHNRSQKHLSCLDNET